MSAGSSLPPEVRIWDALSDFIMDERDKFPRVAGDMDSGDLANAIMQRFDVRERSDAGSEA